MITDKTKELLQKLAFQITQHLIPMTQTQALIVRSDKKLDRIDIKLIKEANKLNRKAIRNDVKFEGSHPNHRRGSITYKSYSIEFKKQLVASIREQMMRDQVSLSKLIREKARQLRIHPKNITRWYHTKELKKKQGGRRALYPEMELNLAKFILNNPTLRRKHILRQAKKIMEDLDIPGREYFNFSKGWYERFRERLAKEKIFNEVKLEYCGKNEVKMEHFDYLKEIVKEQEESQDWQDEEYAHQEDQSSEFEKQARLQEQLQIQELMLSRKHLGKVQGENMNKKNVSLFFDEEEEGVNCQGNISGLSLLDDNKENNYQQFDSKS